MGHCARTISSSFALGMVLGFYAGPGGMCASAILSLCLRAVSAPAAPVGLEGEDPGERGLWRGCRPMGLGREALPGLTDGQRGPSGVCT